MLSWGKCDVVCVWEWFGYLICNLNCFEKEKELILKMIASSDLSVQILCERKALS